MNKFLAVSFGALALAAAGNAAQGQTTEVNPAPAFSGGVDFKSRYVLGDLLVGTAEPVVQGWGSLPLGEHCSLEAWGSHGISTSAGAELDIGGKCHGSLDNQTQVELSVLRYVLHGTDDMTAISATLRRGPLYVSVSQYVWDRNPDATQVEVGYTIAPTERFRLRAVATYETGFGIPNILVGGAEASYSLTSHLSITGSIYTPIYHGAGDTRGTEAIFGLSYSF